MKPALQNSVGFDNCMMQSVNDECIRKRVTDPVRLFAQAMAMSHLIWIVAVWKCARLSSQLIIRHNVSDTSINTRRVCTVGRATSFGFLVENAMTRDGDGAT